MPMTPTPSARRTSRSPETIETVLKAAESVYRADPNARAGAPPTVVDLSTERIASRIDLPLPVVQTVLRDETAALGARLSATVEYVPAPQRGPRHKPFVRVVPPGASAPVGRRGAALAQRFNAVVDTNTRNTRSRPGLDDDSEHVGLGAIPMLDPDFDELDEDGPL